MTENNVSGQTKMDYDRYTFGKKIDASSINLVQYGKISHGERVELFFELQDLVKEYESKSWFYPVPNKSLHNMCLNYGEWDECCLKCHQEWCFYSQDKETKEIMVRDASRYQNNSSSTTIKDVKE